MMTEKQMQLLKGVYKKPFKYEGLGQQIFDADNNMVLDLRGWGRLQYMSDPEERQDAIGEFIAVMLNIHYP